MTTLFNRLQEICRDQGIEKPIGKDIQQITGLTSGRVTQIKQDREAAKLGEDSLTRLIKLGYSPDWIQTGAGRKNIAAEGDRSLGSKVSERDSTYPVTTLPAPKTRRQQSLDEVARLAGLLDDFGLHRLIGMASVLLEQHHVNAKQTHKSSQ